MRQASRLSQSESHDSPHLAVFLASSCRLSSVTTCSSPGFSIPWSWTYISSSISRDLCRLSRVVLVSPQSVKLLGADKPMSAGRTYEISCHVYGANPSPVIKWTRGNDKLKNYEKSVSRFRLQYVVRGSLGRAAVVRCHTAPPRSLNSVSGCGPWFSAGADCDSMAQSDQRHVDAAKPQSFLRAPAGRTIFYLNC